MPELPIYSASGREAPGYSLERRLARLKDLPAERWRISLKGLRVRSVQETLRLTGAAELAKDSGSPIFEGSFEALSLIETTASAGKEIEIGLIREVHRLSSPPSGGEIRTTELAPQFQNALDWLHGDSGRGMFPAERMALWFPRFLEIAPFERGNFRTAHLLLTFFSRADGYPPVSLTFEEAEAVRGEVERAFLFDTGPLVQRFSTALSRAMDAIESGSGEAG